MKKRSSARSVDYWLDRCAWCRSKLGEEDERFAVTARFRSQEDYRKNEGKIIRFELSEEPYSVVGLVVKRDSPARKEGKDILFQVCSHSCRIELTEAIKRKWAHLDAEE